MQRFLVLTVGLTLAIAGAGCSGSSGAKSAASAPNLASTVAAPSTPLPSNPPSSFATLAARLTSDVPPGFVLQADNVGDTGPSDLAKAVRDDGEPDAAAVLRSEGFVRGYQRLWVGARKAQIILFVYQFSTAAGAARDFARGKAGNDKPPAGVHGFVPTGLPAATAIGAVGGAAPGQPAAAAVEFTTGVFDAQIVCNAPAVNGLQARALALAVVQYHRLGVGG